MARMLWMMGGAALVAVGLACGGDVSTSSGLSGVSGAGSVTTDGSCPAAATTGTWSAGTRATLIGIHPDDAYFDESYLSQLPISGQATGEMTLTDGCWMGGPFEADDGTSYYFYKGAFSQP